MNKLQVTPLQLDKHDLHTVKTMLEANLNKRGKPVRVNIDLKDLRVIYAKTGSEVRTKTRHIINRLLAV
jgi:hypothetical protein